MDEEHFPWLGKSAHQPLLPSTSKGGSTREQPKHLGGDKDVTVRSSPPHLLNLFSGKFERANSIAER